ncbi:YbjN domain-containing protein [Corynebacterium sanguinis]|uniref:YbjN domain-containing protein n=1 Tax=Corynebacterium sanguinis TaxID=2594913 RepID=UPI00223C312E|nr:YbjN domain-containing protein [Corynebacterium sanguinis]MCT1629313.1 YbjN domain-containing protein [Corynebacterium sanguinis]
MAEHVTQDRIEALLTDLKLNHFRDSFDGMTRTGFPGLVCYFDVNPRGFKVTTHWLGAATTRHEAIELGLVLNQLNHELRHVRAHPVARGDGKTSVLFEAPFLTAGAVTDTQLRQVIEFYFSTIHRARDVLERRVPHLASKGFPR